MGRILEFLLDLVTASPQALLSVLILGPILLYIAWLTLQVLASM